MAAATQNGGATRVPTVFIGSYAGTTAAQTIDIGFQPNAIIAWDRTTGDRVWVWSSGITTTIVTCDTECAGETITIEKSGQGFTLPASDSSVNEDGQTYDIIAFR